MPSAWIEIDKKALRYNAEGVRSLLKPKTALLAVVKANAYGHGIEQIVSILDKYVDWFGVDNVREARRVRASSQKPILVMGGLEPDLAKEIVSKGFHQIVSDIVALKVLSESANVLAAPANVHIKVDTGMSRQGVRLDKLPELLKVSATLPNIHVSGVATHFANADDIHDDATAQQLELFKKALGTVKRHGLKNIIRHSANSAATLTMPDTHFDLVRVGIAMYGVLPNPKIKAVKSITLKPALSWRTRILQLKDIPKNERVGYGLTERLSRDSRMAVIPVGYADGYDRRLSRTSDVLLRGMRARVVGNISMDMLTVDVTDIPNAAVGDTATLIGTDGLEVVDAQTLAAQMGTIPYEVLARINPALPRIIT